MIIDMHVHPFCKEADWGDDLEAVANILLGTDKKGRRGMYKFFQVLQSKISIHDYISTMDKFGIEKAVIVSFNLTSSYGVCIVNDENLADFISMYPNRFIGYAGIDFLSPDALEQLEYAITSLGLKGVKILPPLQKFDISNQKFDPIWKKMIDLNVPLWSHTADQNSVIGAITKYGHPSLVDDLATRYQDLKIIMGHMGYPWFWEAFSVVSRHPNVYVDVSHHSFFYKYYPWDAFSSTNLEHKLLYASDHPMINWNETIPAIKELDISENFRKKIFYENAKNLLKI